MSETTDLAAGRSRPRSALLIGLGLVLFVILIGLGTWQVQRLHWKEDLLATIDRRTHSAPLALADVEREFAASHDVDYTPVTVTGTFLHQGERHFFSTWQGDSGFNVYTPLQLDDGRFVLVNRGFVPYDLKDPSKRRQGEVAGKVTVTGLARNPLPGKPSMIWVRSSFMSSAPSVVGCRPSSCAAIATHWRTRRLPVRYSLRLPVRK